MKISNFPPVIHFDFSKTRRMDSSSADKSRVSNYRGVTLIEMLVFLFIFTLITVTFYNTWSVGTRYIILAKNRLTASALANEKMEIVRNLAFEDIAHTTGDPSGNLLQDEDVVRSNRAFHVFTQIKNIDDPFDGLCDQTHSADCQAPVDYKHVKITISWDVTESISVSSRFVPAGIEQPDPTRGVLVVNVTSDKADGAVVEESTVRIRNADTGLDETHSTDNFGRLIMSGLLESSNKYEITLAKSGWEDVSTMPSYPDSPYNPIHENASVVAGAVNTIDMFQNELSSLIIRTVDYLGNDVSNIHFYIHGGRQIGTTADEAHLPIYGLEDHEQTGSDGQKKYEQANPGNYDLSLEESEQKIIGLSPNVPFSLTPGEEKTLTMKVCPQSMTALLVNVRDDIIEGQPGPPLSEAEVHLTNGLGYDTTITTSADGLAFFPNTENPPFVSGTYNLSISVSGFQNYSSQVSVSEGSLKEEVVPMSPSI